MFIISVHLYASNFFVSGAVKRLDLTDRERLSYAFIRDYLDHYNRPPTLREISTGIGVRSATSARNLIRALEKKGYVELDAGRARGIRLLRSDNKDSPWDARTQSLNLLEPDESGARLGRAPSTIQVDMLFLRGISRPESCFVVRAGDFGMVPDGVLRGDLVVVEPLPDGQFAPGSLVVYRSAGEFLVRRYQEYGASRILSASDRTFAIVELGSRATIQRLMGRVIGVMRRL